MISRGSFKVFFVFSVDLWKAVIAVPAHTYTHTRNMNAQLSERVSITPYRIQFNQKREAAAAATTMPAGNCTIKVRFFLIKHMFNLTEQKCDCCCWKEKQWRKENRSPHTANRQKQNSGPSILCFFLFFYYKHIYLMNEFRGIVWLLATKAKIYEWNYFVMRRLNIFVHFM